MESSGPKRWAAGLPGVGVGLSRGLTEMGAARSWRTLRVLNQRGGIDCPGCAWPEPEQRHLVEFCENGAKAVAEEATTRRVDAGFLAEHSIAELAGREEFWLGKRGRLTEPMIKEPGDTHYRPISWPAAFTTIAEHLRALSTPDEAVFYTSGRTSNEAAFLYQLLARCLGTNNLPDCSNMCHESSGAALTETIGVGKGSVTLADFDQADLIVVVGQNPGTNHPRMLTTLEAAKRRGAAIVAINPLPEAGLLRFKNPQTPRGVLGAGTELADDLLPIRIGGDQAFFQAIGAFLTDSRAVDLDFVNEYTDGFDRYAESIRTLDWSDVDAATGLPRARVLEVAQRFASAERIIVCWAMGLTQHRDAVATIREIVNVMLLRGMIGKPGAGLCPVRGHSNVQGDRTMGIWERMPTSFLDRLDAEFGVTVPREPGLDTVESIKAMRDGRARVFIGLGGNFASATPDTAVTEAALRSCELTVQVSTKLNRSHVVTGRTALILPTLGRTDEDQGPGGARFVSVEDSMSVVHTSTGRLRPPSPHLLSEVDIIRGLAAALFDSEHPVPWADFVDYDLIRERIARVVPGFEDYNRRVLDGFVLPHPPRDARRFPTATGTARFTVNPLTVIRVPEGRLLLQTMRSHDQFNTTIYGLDDRYRGVSGDRRVVLVNPDDLTELGIAEGGRVDLVSEWPDEPDRCAPGFRVLAYPTARGCAAAYFPETNGLVSLSATAAVSNTPISKSIIIRLVPPGSAATPMDGSR